MTGQTSTCVRKMVRHVIQNMEDFQHNLDSVVQDLQRLIRDIDTVTTEIEERFDRKSTKRCIHQNGTECPRREDALQKLLDTVRTVDESPDLDLSYLDISTSYQRPRWGRSLSFPVSSFKLSSLVNPKEEFREEYNATSFVCNESNSEDQRKRDSIVRTTRCTAQLKESAKIVTIVPEFKSSISTIDRHSSSSNSSGTYKEINSIKRTTASFENTQHAIVEATTQTSFTLDSSSEFDGDVFRNDVPEPLYTGSYEREMELELENLIESYRQTRDPDDWLMETGSSTRIGSSDEEAELAQELNTWMSFTLPNTAPPSESSESSFSASESDIVNHNTHATTVYGNLIFSDNLVIMPSRSRKVIERFDV